MPHFRKRWIEESMLKALRLSPVVSLFGHRQVGKTTLASRAAARYISLDLRENLNAAEMSPGSFLEHNQALPLAIDECQWSPALFPALKEFVRLHKQPNQFLLTGSVRFSSRKQIRESLTGRSIHFELTPMGLHELHERKPVLQWSQILQKKNVELLIKQKAIFGDADLRKYIEYGGLPGMFSVRDENLRQRKWESQFETLLERDLRLLIQTTLDYPVLRNLLQVLAEKQGEPLDWSQISRRASVSAPALKRLISAFQSMFLIRVLPTLGDEKRPTLFFEDLGEGRYLSPQNSEEQILLCLLFGSLRPVLEYYFLIKADWFQYRTRGGASVPLAFRSPFGTVGFMISPFEEASTKAIRSAQSFLKHFPDSIVLIVHSGKRAHVIQKNLAVVPIHLVLS